jgi:hypothetical protein
MDTAPKQPVDISDESLRRAWRDCAISNLTFEETMKIPALATALRALATRNIRRHQAFMEQRRTDLKLAQANDHPEYD